MIHKPFLFSGSPDPEAERLRDLLATYQRFVGHDLLNQLVSVQAYTRMLLESDSLADEDSRQVLHRLAQIGQRLGEQSRRLTDVGRLLREPPWGPPVPLEDPASEAIATFRCTNNIHQSIDISSFSFVLAANLPSLPVSANLLGQVLFELLEYAVSTTRPDSCRRIEILGHCSLVEGMIAIHYPGLAPSPPSDSVLLLSRQAATLWGGQLTVSSCRSEKMQITLTLRLPPGEPL